MYPDLPQAILNPTSLRHKLGMFTPAEWSSFPGLYRKQIPNKARKLARLNTELLHGQSLLRNESISDKEIITKDALQRLRNRRQAKTLRSIDRLADAIQRNKKRERDWYHSRQKCRNSPWIGTIPITSQHETKHPANDDIISATLHIIATTLNSDSPPHIWIRDPGFYNSIRNTIPGEDRQETLASAATQLSTSTNGATAFDYNWLLFP